MNREQARIGTRVRVVAGQYAGQSGMVCYIVNLSETGGVRIRLDSGAIVAVGLEQIER